MGIGIDILKKSELYYDIIETNKILVKKYGSKTDLNKNCPHLNLYDLSIPKENLKYIILKIKEILVDQKPFIIKTKKVNYFSFGIIFLEIEPNQELKTLHKKIVKEVSKLKGTCIDNDYLAPHRTYTKKQKELLLKYGNPFVLDQFQPHITIGFVNNQKDTLANICKELNTYIKSNKFQVDCIQIVSGEKHKKVNLNF
ncbi:MAG: 2'-5' RNA ligase family protein [Candidatus Paceibacterota bacterium]